VSIFVYERIWQFYWLKGVNGALKPARRWPSWGEFKWWSNFKTSF